MDDFMGHTRWKTSVPGLTPWCKLLYTFIINLFLTPLAQRPKNRWFQTFNAHSVGDPCIFLPSLYSAEIHRTRAIFLLWTVWVSLHVYQCLKWIQKSAGSLRRRRRIEAPKAPRGVGCGEGCPPPHWGRGLGRKFFWICRAPLSENGEFWCILSGILAGVCSYKRVKRWTQRRDKERKRDNNPAEVYSVVERGDLLQWNVGTEYCRVLT